MKTQIIKGGVYAAADYAYEKLQTVVQNGTLDEFIKYLEKFEGGQVDISIVTGTRKQILFVENTSECASVEILELKYHCEDSNVTHNACVISKQYNYDNEVVEEFWYNNNSAASI